jgi:CIC family chloride channel protein
MTAISFGTMTLWATFGNIPAFQVTMAPPDDLATLLLLTLVGALMGALGAAYNRSIIFSMNTLDRFGMIPAEARAALIGIFVGLTGWFYLEALGGGEAQVQQLLNGNILMPFSALILFATRWVMGPMCYATGVPGGIFSPLLLIGALAGALLWQLITMASGIHLEMTSFVLIGMAAFFASVVRAPFTGILLITEMTASTAHMVPLLTGSIAAVVVATLLRNPPIYDELRNRTLTASKHV